MKLLSFAVENFRGYSDKVVLNIGDFTGLFGKNDAGKSTIFEAMDIFFNESSAQKKINENDWNVHVQTLDSEIVMTAVFDNLPTTLVLEDVEAYVKDEALTDQNGNIQIIKRFSRSNGKINTITSILSLYPEDKENIYELTQAKLRALLKELLPDSAAEKTNTAMRREILNTWALDNKLVEREIQIGTKGLSKSIWEALKSQLPDFQLFKSDRDNSDTDPEVQNPMTALVKNVLDDPEINELLANVQQRIVSQLESSTQDVLDILNQLNPELRVSLNPSFGDVNWSKAFKLTLATELGIPLENRGSGVRRLVLLSYFQNEARKKRLSASTKVRETIYAVEEPETALHPIHQKMLIAALKGMSEQDNIQILLTTHSPEMAKFLPVEYANLIKRENNTSTLISGEEAVDQIAADLGILTDLNAIKDKTIVIVEGKWDLIAITRQILPALLSEDKIKKWNENIILIPVGGTNIDTWKQYKTIEQFNLKYYAIVDGDDAGNKYKLGQGNNVIQLKRPAIEFYLPYNHVTSTLKKVCYPGNDTFQEFEVDSTIIMDQDGWNDGTAGFSRDASDKIKLFYNNINGFIKNKEGKYNKTNKFKGKAWQEIPDKTITKESLKTLICDDTTAYDEWCEIIDSILNDSKEMVKD